MNYIKYLHVERFGTDEVDGIQYGTVVVQPKIDGSNGVVFYDAESDYKIKAGSRTRELSLLKDNQGFYAMILSDERIKKFYENPKNQELILYGEFLLSHSLKTYRDEAWRKFYIFDVAGLVMNTDGQTQLRYFPYDEYKPLLEEYGLDYIPVIATVENGTYEQFVNLLEQTTFLIKDGLGSGEGIVLKNYLYRNRFGRYAVAKIVKSEFKELHAKTMGGIKVEGEKMVEQEIVDKYVTTALVEKTYEKIKNEEGWSSKNIPELLGRVWHDLIVEDGFNFVKQFKNPKIDFKTLNYLCIMKIKEIRKK